MFKNKNKLSLKIKKCLDNYESKLDLSNMQLTSIPIDVLKLSNIDVLILDNNKISLIDNIPSNVKYLSLCNNSISYANTLALPKHLQILQLSNNSLTNLDISDTNIITLICDHNNLTTVKLNDTIKSLNVSHNSLTEINLPDSLETYNCSFNELSSFNNIPINLKTFVGHKNPFRKISSQIVKLENCIGLADDVVTSLENFYAIKIQKMIRRFLIYNKNHKYVLFNKVLRHIVEVGMLLKNTDNKVLSVYFKNPNATICKSEGYYHKVENI